MKKILVILITLFVTGSSQAQQAPEKHLSKQEHVSNLSKTLSVDKKRAEEISNALDYNIEKIRSIARDTSQSPKARQEYIQKLHEERQAKIKSVLTEEQYARMQASLAPRIAQRRAESEQQRQARVQKIQEKGTNVEEKKAAQQP